MESNIYQLPDQLQHRIQGIVGEMVAENYVVKNIEDNANFGDEIITVTNRCNSIKPKGGLRPPIGFRPVTVNESPRDFLYHNLVDYFPQIGCEGVDLTNADVESKNLFEEYKSKTKEKILSELDQLFVDFRKERERLIEKIKEARKIEGVDNEENEPMISERIKTLSHGDLAKALTLIELERRTKDKKRRYKDKNILESDTFEKIRHITLFSKLFISPLNIEKDKTDYRNLLKTVSKYVNTKYEKLNIFSSLYNGITQTETRIDLMIVHCSDEGTLKKLIIIECKAGNSGLSKNQKAFANYIKRMESDKIEYKVINVDYQVPKQLVLREE